MQYLEEYFKDEFTCPSCGAKNGLEAVNEPQVVGGIELIVQCIYCDKSFMETYKINNIVEITHE